MTEFIEWGKSPKDGMKLIGFSCEASIEGIELKNKLYPLIKNRGDIGLRQAASLLINEALVSKNDSVALVKRMKNDISKKGAQYFLNSKYNYTLNRVFWGYEKDIPKDDKRYFLLDMIDTQLFSSEKEVNAAIQESFSSQKMKDKLKLISINEIKPTSDNESYSSLADKDWENQTKNERSSVRRK